MAGPAAGANKPAAARVTAVAGSGASARSAASTPAPASPAGRSPTAVGPVFSGNRRPVAPRPDTETAVTVAETRKPRRRIAAETVVDSALWFTAAFYAASAALIFYLAAQPVRPAGLDVGTPLDHALLAGAAAVLAAASAFLYSVPHRLGGHLWSVPLGVVHVVAFNIGFLSGAFGLHVLRDLASAGWGTAAVVSVVAHTVWLVAMGVNLAQSFKTIGAGPADDAGPDPSAEERA